MLKSYQEACIAITLPRLMGKKSFIQHFSQLGVFAIIFANEPETVKNYCLQVLGKIIEHDKKYGTDLLDTLRILLDNSCSWTTTANQMYVHVNTVYYRMFKVQKLLNVDFSLFETRLHLYTAIRAWDTLNMWVPGIDGKRQSTGKPPLPIPDVEIIKTIHTHIVIIGLAWPEWCCFVSLGSRSRQ